MKEFSKDHVRRIFYSYLATGVQNGKCLIEATYDNFKTVDITNIHDLVRVKANVTAGNNPTGPSERTATLSSLSHPNN